MIKVSDVLASSADKYPENVALRYDQSGITYSRLREIVYQLSTELYSYSSDKGGKILVFLPNCPEFVIAFFAIVSIGKIAVLADVKYNEELLTVLNDNRIDFIITDCEHLDKLKAILAEWSNYSIRVLDFLYDDNRGICISEYCMADNSLILSKTAEIAIKTSEIEQVAINKDDEALILYTSGSIGRPKGVSNTHRTLLHALQNYTKTVDLRENDRMIAVTPFYHSYCMGSCFLAGIASGATLLLIRNFNPRKLLQTIESEKATVFHGVPFMYNLLNQHYDRTRYNIDSLRLCITAGAQLPRKVEEGFFELTNKVIHQEYGSSETGTIAINCSNDMELNIASVGRPLKNVSVRIVDEENIGGIIEVKSSGQSIGYVGHEDFGRGWYNTGDLGRIDENGYIHIMGRVKKLINISGLKLNPKEVEDVLQAHPDVLNASVRSKQHEEFGEIVEALVVRSNDSLTVEELREYCKLKLALYKIPTVFTWVDESNQSSLGKVKWEK